MQQDTKSERIKCVGVPYRQGWVEVAVGVHRGYVNLESWSVAPDVDITHHSAELALLPDETVSGNAELELSLEQARALVLALQEAIERAEHDVANPSFQGSRPRSRAALCP